MLNKCVIISCNEQTSKQIYSFVKRFNKEVIVCTSITQFVQVFLHNDINSYVLDICDGENEFTSKFAPLYPIFLQTIPPEMRIICGKNTKNSEQVSINNFLISYIELLTKKTSTLKVALKN